MRKVFRVAGLVLILLSIFMVEANQKQCAINSVYRNAGCIPCNQLLNTAESFLTTDRKLNSCQCKLGYQWQQSNLECQYIGKQFAQTQKHHSRATNLKIPAANRILQTSCDISQGFINLKGQCVNCRIFDTSTGFAYSNYDCYCQPPYLWWANLQICGCHSYQDKNLLTNMYKYVNSGACLFCNQITDNNELSNCIKCQGNPFAYSNLGCINCSAIPHGLSSNATDSLGISVCLCQTGYIYSYSLGACICDKYYFQTSSGCQACSLLSNQNAVNDCNKCQNSYFYNGYYCQQSSNIQNFDPQINRCKIGYALNTNPINGQALGCVCSASGGYYLTGSACQSCDNLKNISNQSYQNCVVCSQPNGYFMGSVECVYCPSLQYTTGNATIDGCQCLPIYSWNTLTNLCQCDWTKGFFTSGTTCLSCLNIANTIESTNNNGCNCIQGFSWNSDTHACQCDQNQGNFYLSTVEGCINCNAIQWSTGKSINQTSCQCLKGTIWSPTQINCICDSNQNMVLIGTQCLACNSLRFTNGFASSRGCGCLPGYIWIQSQATCDCPQGYVNMGNQCIICSVAIANLTNATIDGCTECLMKENFALYESICYLCSRQSWASGKVSILNQCDCINNDLMSWFPTLGGCACNIGYYSIINSNQLSCSTCGSACNCIGALGSKICSVCSSVAYSTGQLKQDKCVCYPGYAWSISIGVPIYPFKCICSISANGYINGSTCYNCSTFPLNGNVTAAGCSKCDPSQGFLYIPSTMSCIVCSMPRSNGKATVSGCGCLEGVWNSESLTCDIFNCNITNCETCLSDLSCYTCKSGYLLKSDQNKCSPNCQIAYCDQCLSASTCHSCITGYILNSNQTRCLEIQCFSNCRVCLSNNTCLSCLSGYLLSNDSSKCLFDCGILHCLICASSVTCSQCSAGYIMSNQDNTICLLICTSSNCKSCQMNTTKCGLCNLGFTLYLGQCYYDSCINNCKLCTSPTVCSFCINGYTLTQNGSFCSPNCAISNCIDCPSAENCSICSPGYYLDSNSTSCLIICSSLNCQYCQSNSNNCTKCKSGFKMLNYQCYQTQCIQNCDLCLSSSTCLSCLSGYSPSYNSRQCVSICNNPTCQMCDQSHNYCNKCSSGYYTLSGYCYLDICDIPNCLLCRSSYTCQQCRANYTYNIVDNDCELTCSLMFGNCLQCSLETGCSLCQQGYLLGIGFSNMSNCIPLCSIANCWICQTDQTCLICNRNFSLSQDYKQCQLQCSVINCANCQNSNICSQCMPGYSLLNNTCIQICPTTFYSAAVSPSIACSLCPKRCQSCSFFNNSYICLECQNTDFLDTTTKKCIDCSYYDPNCLLCTSQGCTTCKIPYTLMLDGSCQNVSCLVLNCLICSTQSNSSCLICSDGFVFEIYSGTCVNVGCPVGFVFSGQSCVCPQASMLINQNCQPCSSAYCQQCNLLGCLNCITGYYLSLDLACLSCPDNCDQCNSQYCSQCSFGFSLLQGMCYFTGVSSVIYGNSIFSCNPACITCSITLNNAINCLSIKDGYGFFWGKTFQCYNQTCRTCTLWNMLCTSCFKGYTLLGGYCYACKDPYALSCSATNLNYSLSCVNGYTTAANSVSVGGFCLPCAENCNKCDFNGPQKCDMFQCALGFVQLQGTMNCTACLNSCPICDVNDINSCIDCGPGRYKDITSMCLGCPSGCESCTSETLCTGCLLGYSLVNSLCISNVGFPCATTGPNSHCSKCFKGYILNGTNCILDISCNSQLNCISCPYGYYLFNFTCLFCAQMPQNCLTCDSIVGNCLLCKKGFYFSNFNCYSCPQNCLDCSSSSFCNQAAEGYYLDLLWDGSNSGRVKACSSPCLTCAYSSQYCLSCIAGYNISGSTCFSTSTVGIQLVLSASSSASSIFSQSDSDSVQLAKIIKNINWLTNSFCIILPDILKNNGSCIGVFRFTSFYIGSIIVNAQINTNGVEDVAQIQNSILQNLNSIGIPGVNIVSANIISPSSPNSPSSTTNTSSSSSVVGVVVGVVVGCVALIIIVIIVVCVIKKRRQKVDDLQVSSEVIQSKGLQSSKSIIPSVQKIDIIPSTESKQLEQAKGSTSSLDVLRVQPTDS